MEIRYPVYQPFIAGNEKKYVTDCLDSTWISSKGKYVEMFESGFAEYMGVRNAVAVTNGTVALHVALVALGIGPGDEVLVPSLTYIASANAIAYTGATPVFVDSEPQYWQMDLRDAEAKVTERTKAIMPVHLYGHMCDMDAVEALAQRHSLSVVEDCAEALASKYHNSFSGTFGDIATFSFFGNKTLTTGEGGMVVTNDDHLADHVRKLKGQGLAANKEYWHDIIGFNYRMTNICAAIGCAQLENIDYVIAEKQRVAHQYRQLLRDVPVEVHGQAPDCFNSYWMVSVLARSWAEREALRAALIEHGVETRPLFNPLHLMGLYGQPPQSLPVAEDLSTRGINLPSYPKLSNADIAEISSVVQSCLTAWAS